jgi:hypothetical protein
MKRESCAQTSPELDEEMSREGEKVSYMNAT